MDEQTDLPLPPKDLPLPDPKLPEPEKLLREPTFAEKYYGSKWYIPLLVFLLILLFSGYYFFGGAQLIQNIIAPAATPTPTPIATTQTPDPTADWKTYTQTGNVNWSIKYPVTLEVSTAELENRSNYLTKVPWVMFKSPNFNMNISIEPNTQHLSLDEWIDERKKQEKEKCEIDCPGFSDNKAEKITVAGRDAIIQNLSSAVQTVNIYIPLSNDTILWASSFSTSSSLVTPETKNMLIQIMNTIEVNKTPSSTCTPRPACLDSEPRCMIAETEDMCPAVTQKPTGDQVMCTMEAKLCPDGSYVGRSGPNCEFTACP